MLFSNCLLSVPYLFVCNAFLLDVNNYPNGQNVAPGYYLTVTEFLEAQQQQHRETEALHQTIDKTLAVLTSQLHDRFAMLEQKLKDHTNTNETFLSGEVLERKYHELADNYTRLENLVNALQTQNAEKENQLIRLRNFTSDLDTRIRHVDELKSHQLETLKHDVQVINAQTGLLRSNELARNQEFFALYNETLALKTTASEKENQTVTMLKNLENGQNMSFIQLQNEIDRTRMDAERFYNKTILELNKLSSEINEQVAITACLSSHSGSVSSGYVIKFDDVKSVIGVKDVSSFKASGKFTCEKEGLYHISASVLSFTTGDYFCLKVNGNIYSQAYNDPKSGGYYLRTTAVATAVLNVNDTVWVETFNPMYVHCCYTCLTVVKVK